MDSEGHADSEHKEIRGKMGETAAFQRTVGEKFAVEILNRKGRCCVAEEPV